MFYAAMYALKGREDRRAAAALQQMTGVDLGGQPGAPAPLAPRAAPLSWRCSVRCAGPPDPVGPLQLQERPPRLRAGTLRAAAAGGVPVPPARCASAPAACSHRWRSLTACALSSPRRGCTSAHHVARLAVEQPDVPRAGHRRLRPLWHHLRRQHLPAGASPAGAGVGCCSRAWPRAGYRTLADLRARARATRGSLIRHTPHARAHVPARLAPPLAPFVNV